MDLPTRLDLLAVGRNHILAQNPKIDPAQVDTDGSDVNIVVGTGSVVAHHVVQQIASRFAAHYLDSADGEDLDRFERDHYDQARKGAGAARGGETFSRATAGAGAGTVPTGTKVRSNTSVEYITTSQAVFAASDLSASCNIRAVQAGSIGQAAAGAVNQIANPGILFDTTLTVSNSLALAGGEEREGDEQYRERGRAFWKAARRGTLAAIELGGVDTIGVASARAAEVTLGGYPQRAVLLYVADTSGMSNVQLANQVDATLDEFRAAGINVLVQTSMPQMADIVVKLVFNANVDTEAVSNNVFSALIEFVNSLNVNEVLTRAALNGILLRFKQDGLIIDDGSLVAPTGDIVPDPGRTIRTDAQHVKAA